MSAQAEILARFAGEAGGEPLFLPDLTLWYAWHRGQGTLPVRWAGLSLPRVAHALGMPAWLGVRPWRVENPAVMTTRTERDGERVTRIETSAGTLTSRWTLGPEGDWWQTEYPVKTSGDLKAVLEAVQARSYVLDTSALLEHTTDVGQTGVVAIELPRRPYSDLLHDFLGWSDGLVFLRDPLIPEVNGILEAKLQDLVREVANLPGSLALSPDNLDSQFISPKAFDAYLAESYRTTAQALHQNGKHLVVHIGGPIRRLLPALAETGVDGLEGIAGPPQSDLTLAEAREVVGASVTLWGGIPQDLLLDTHPSREFENAVKQAARDAADDKRVLVGVADRVPVGADLGRLQAIPALIQDVLVS